MAKLIVVAILLNVLLCKTVNSQTTKRKPDYFAVNKDGLREINIASLLPADDWRLFSIKRVSPAIEIAIEKVNPTLVSSNCTLVVKFRDSNCDIADGINEAINFYVHNEVHVLFGPCCDYAVAPVARQVRYWDVPMMTAGGLAGDFGLSKQMVFSTLTRVGPNFNTLVHFFITVLRYYKWKKVRLIYHPEGQREVLSRHCHIAANDIHYGFRYASDVLNLTLEQDYKKFESDQEILTNIEDFIGLHFAGKFICSM